MNRSMAASSETPGAGAGVHQRYYLRNTTVRSQRRDVCSSSVHRVFPVSGSDNGRSTATELNRSSSSRALRRTPVCPGKLVNLRPDRLPAGERSPSAGKVASNT